MTATKKTATEKRQNFVDTTVAAFVDQETGEFIADIDVLDFAELRRFVSDGQQMYPHNRKWQKGLAEWKGCIDYATNHFNEQFGFLPPINVGCFTFEMEREYVRLLKWAVLQGAIYAAYGS